MPILQKILTRRRNPRQLQVLSPPAVRGVTWLKPRPSKEAEVSKAVPVEEPAEVEPTVTSSSTETEAEPVA